MTSEPLKKPVVILVGGNPERGGVGWGDLRSPRAGRSPNSGSLPPAPGSLPIALSSPLADQPCSCELLATTRGPSRS